MPVFTTFSPPAPSTRQEEWPDADFDLPDGVPLHTPDAESDKEDEEDWDVEMDLGHTGGAKAKAVLEGIAARSGRQSAGPVQMITIRPPQPQTESMDEEDEGISTIKVSALPRKSSIQSLAAFDDDLESAFALPDDMTQLSLRPLSLHHRSSKSSFEWTDKDQTSSSQSSDAFTSLGFADTPPSPNYTSASSTASLVDACTDDEEEDEGELDGLVLPSGLFESGHGAKHFTKVLEMKKKLPPIDERVKIASPDPEDDFEMGLVIDDDVKFSPSRLLHAKQQSRMKLTQARSKSAPSHPPISQRPPSRTRAERAKSPLNPPPSSLRQLRALATSPIPNLRPTSATRSQTFQALASPPVTGPPTSFLSPKPGSLRGQKSHTGLKPPSPPSQRKLTRKASLSSLTDNKQAQASGSGVPSGKDVPRYEAHTAASRAKTHNTTRVTGLDFQVPPTRPSTPSSNPVAVRLTMPTSSFRAKTRPAISSVFPVAGPSSAGPRRPTSPLASGSRPPSSFAMSRSSLLASPPPSNVPKVLRKPKRGRTYGDGTELDNIDDLPTDRDKEARFRVKPSGYGNRVPGGSYPSKGLDQGTMRRKPSSREASEGTGDVSPGRTLRRSSGIDFSKSSSPETKKKKKKLSPTTGQTPRKPTLIRNLGGSAAPKVVGEMKWNPQTLRWEGNDQVLRDFDAAVGTSTRPALITHLTGSSIGSPVGSFASGARIVGNMIFDPTRMCWISTLPPDEEEPDVFADLADDEEEDWEAKGGTIRANQQAPSNTSSTSGTGTPIADVSGTSSTSKVEPPSPARSHSRTFSDSGSERGSRASMVCDVDDSFADNCHHAEGRHRLEMQGWRLRPNARDYLFEIRALATRQY